MSIIKVSCIDQTLAFENTPRIASGGSGEDFLQFTFCSAWDDFTRTVSFWRKGGAIYTKNLSDDNICEIPAALTKGEGIIYFGVYGSHEDGRRRTSEVLTYQIVQGAIAPGEIVPGGDIILTVLQSKTVTPTGKQFVVLPDAGYTGLSDVTVEGDGNLKPWNIPKGITIYGVPGELEIGVTPGGTDWPFPPPVDPENPEPDEVPTEDKYDAVYRATWGEDPPDDWFLLADNLGNVTKGYMFGDDFSIIDYDPATTEFKAIGWRRVSWHTTGESAGTFSTKSFLDEASTGWNYLNNIRRCTRETLYYNDVEVWPNNPYAGLWNYNGMFLPPLPPELDLTVYPHLYIQRSSFATQLLAFSEPMRNIPVSGTSGYLSTVYGGKPSAFMCNVVVVNGLPDTDHWGYLQTEEIPFGYLTFDSLLYSNTDIYNEDGTLCRAADSNPIPV